MLEDEKQNRMRKIILIAIICFAISNGISAQNIGETWLLSKVDITETINGSATHREISATDTNGLAYFIGPKEVVFVSANELRYKRMASDDFEVVVESKNSGMNLDGSVAQGDLVKYVSTTPVFDAAGVLQVNLTILEMLSGYNTALVIKNKTLGTELYRGDLLGTLLLKNPTVNLDCNHDFTIRFMAADKCDCGTYVIKEIWVNNWLVHSYDADLN